MEFMSASSKVAERIMQGRFMICLQFSAECIPNDGWKAGIKNINLDIPYGRKLEL